MQLEDYTTGTVSIAKGSATLTGSGTAWSIADLKEGDTFYKDGYAILIASVDSDTSITLADAWPGIALSGATYVIRYQPDNSRMQGTTRQLLDELRQGIWLTPDATGKTADKATYDAKAAGFRFLDVSVDPFKLYVKESDTSGDWSDGADWVGPKGDKGDQGATGADGDITWEGAWATATAYTVNQAVAESGSSYVCIENHTSGTFADDLAADKWELMAEKGDKGDAGDISSTDTDASSFGFVLDEDDMASDSDTKVPTQQSVNQGKLQKIATRTAMKALDGSKHLAVYLMEGGRQGQFQWDSSDLSTEVAVDTQEGVYVAPSSDATGASGAWVRPHIDTFNVQWFGAKGDGATDDADAFQAALDMLPVSGGTVDVPTAEYVIGTAPDEGSKSIIWNFAPGSVFSGAGTGAQKFPYMNTNVAQMAVGPHIRSRSPLNATDGPGGKNGGIGALNVEMLQPSDYSEGNSVAIYAGARGSSPDPTANVWAFNPLISADAGAGGIYQCIEVDVNCFSDDASMKGISITGLGTAAPDVGLEITRVPGTLWSNGITVQQCETGMTMIIDPTGIIRRGLSVYPAGSAPAVIADVAASIRQVANSADTIFLQRFTNTAPGGYYIRGVNETNTVNIFSVDINGNFAGSSFVSIGPIRSIGATNGIGYGTGAGGTVTQATSKSTGVTLNKVTGKITMNAAALASAAKVSFAVTNSAVAATDVVIVNVSSGGTASAYRADVTAVATGSFTITVENITGGSLSEAPVINFAVIKAVTA